MTKKTYLIIGIILVLAVIAGVMYFKKGAPGIKEILEGGKPTVVQETLEIPETEEVISNTGREFSSGPVDVPLVPETEKEKVVVPMAFLTVKAAYALSLPLAKEWKGDCQLSFIKSAAAVNLEGKSSQWQVVFVSKVAAGKAYEIIIQKNEVVSEKELPSTSQGGELPEDWFDSDRAVGILAEMPQFSGATISAINFFYNPDAKTWRYGLSTSLGATSIEVK